MMSMDGGLEEQIGGSHDMFTMDSGYRQPQDVINQLQMNEQMAMAGSLNQYPYAPAQSPPTMFQQQPMPHPMPPRPRPEGGQDPSPNFLNEGELPGSAAAAAAGFKNNIAQNSGKKEDLLVIDSWTGGPTASPATNEDNDKFYLRANSVEEKEQSGWGAPPPSN